MKSMPSSGDFWTPQARQNSRLVAEAETAGRPVLCSVDRAQSYHRLCNDNGDLYPSMHTKLHRPRRDDPALAACSSRVVLNDDYDDYQWAELRREDVCQRCVPGWPIRG